MTQTPQIGGVLLGADEQHPADTRLFVHARDALNLATACADHLLC